MYKLILASQSPRRRQLLAEAGFSFQVSSIEVSENIGININPEVAATTIARRKAKAWTSAHKHLKSQRILVLSADTIVAFGDRLLGKPKNFSEAKEFLRLLSGKTHSVITGFCIFAMDSGTVYEQAVVTDVTFRPLADEEISDYVASGEPMDKAGAYAIQGEGGKFVQNYQGSWSNVVGLPMEQVELALGSHGWHVDRS